MSWSGLARQIVQVWFCVSVTLKIFNHSIFKEPTFIYFNVLMVDRKRSVSFANNNILTCANNTFPCHCIVCLVKDESTCNSRLALLHAIQAFLMCPRNKKCAHSYAANDASDWTPQSHTDLKPKTWQLHNFSVKSWKTLMMVECANCSLLYSDFAHMQLIKLNFLQLDSIVEIAARFNLPVNNAS
jgi:hypothetical protein